MNAEPKVSVIVPIYNVEKYLCQCVESICAQTLQEIEILLVDDGSKDSSPAICDEYAAKDSRVQVIHKKNAGLGTAYNAGIAAAKGEYIGFVESDDWIESEMYEEPYSKARKEDVDVITAPHSLPSVVPVTPPVFSLTTQLPAASSAGSRATPISAPSLPQRGSGNNTAAFKS